MSRLVEDALEDSMRQVNNEEDYYQKEEEFLGPDLFQSIFEQVNSNSYSEESGINVNVTLDEDTDRDTVATILEKHVSSNEKELTNKHDELKKRINSLYSKLSNIRDNKIHQRTANGYLPTTSMLILPYVDQLMLDGELDKETLSTYVSNFNHLNINLFDLVKILESYYTNLARYYLTPKTSNLVSITKTYNDEISKLFSRKTINIPGNKLLTIKETSPGMLIKLPKPKSKGEVQSKVVNTTLPSMSFIIQFTDQLIELTLHVDKLVNTLNERLSGGWKEASLKAVSNIRDLDNIEDLRPLSYPQHIQIMRLTRGMLIDINKLTGALDKMVISYDIRK